MTAALQSAGAPGQALFERQLGAFLPLVLDVGEADHVCRRLALGIFAVDRSVAHQLALAAHGEIHLAVMSGRILDPDAEHGHVHAAGVEERWWLATRRASRDHAVQAVLAAARPFRAYRLKADLSFW